MSERPFAAHDLPARSFPFTVRQIDADTDELLSETVVDGPGVMDITGWAPRRVRVEIYWGDGSVTKMDPQ